MSSTIEVWLTDGARVIEPPLRVPALGGYDAAIAEIARLYGEPRGNVRFSSATPLTFQIGKHVKLRPGERFVAPKVAATSAKPTLRTLATALGFTHFGVTAPELPERYTARFAKWLDSGAHAGMGFLDRGRQKRLLPAQSSARSVIVLATPYDPAPSDGVARYASVRDYHAVIPPRLDVMKRALRALGSARNFVSCDTGPVLERAYAEQAGLGWIGKNGMLISRTHGSFLLLATVWTELDLPFDAPHPESCGTCDACKPACPTDAIVAPGLVDARKCLAYWTIEHEGPFPPETPPLHGWTFGCDACQDACPWNRFAQQAAIGPLGEKRVLPEGWEHMTAETLDAHLRGTPMTRAGAEGLLRNRLRVMNGE